MFEPLALETWGGLQPKVDFKSLTSVKVKLSTFFEMNCLYTRPWHYSNGVVVALVQTTQKSGSYRT